MPRTLYLMGMKVSKTTKALLDEVTAYCEENDARFTEPRRLVLSIIAESKQPVGAYDIMEKLGAYLDKPKPPTVYRALEFLQSAGFVHKIESLNAFVSCHAGHHHDGSQFMVCDECGHVEEVHLCDLPPPFQKKMTQSGFTMRHWNIELHGACAACSK